METQSEPSTSPSPVPDEPTVLDYFKARLTFWRPTDIRIPDPDEISIPDDSPGFQEEPIPAFLRKPVRNEGAQSRTISVPWVVLIAVAMALLAQFALEPSNRNLWIGLGAYTATAVLVAWTYIKGLWVPSPLTNDIRRPMTIRVLRDPFIASLLLGAVAFLAFGVERFTPINLLIWLMSIVCFIVAVWIPSGEPKRSLRERLAILRGRDWTVADTRWVLLFLATAAIVLFFRIDQLNEVPSEMVSDHAEKLLDISDVLNGQYNIFFPRNTGREAFQFYLTALIIKLFHTGLTFTSLKLGTVLAGLVTLWYIYLLGKEIGNRWIGLFAFALCGIAYWPNIISRFGLRFPFYPLFVAPALFYLLRGIRTSNRNDFIFAGLALGLGLHGYSPFRIVPFVVVAAFILFLLHRQGRGMGKQTIANLAIVSMMALLVFIPLLRYTIDNPEIVASRSLTRLTGAEQAITGSLVQIFFSNLWNAVTMFFWSDGEVWVHSIPYRPALDVITAGLFFCGLVQIAIRYIHQRHWLDLFLILSIPMLMLPSILSLAFPGENPSLNRTGGAYIPLFLIAAIGLEGLLVSLKKKLDSDLGTTIVWTVGLLLFFLSASQNYDLVFRQYKTLYDANAMNTSEAGEVVHAFANSIGTPETVWVVAYPYWLDTRLIGINAGYPTRDYAISTDQIPGTTADSRTKLFLLNLQDTTDLDLLKSLYPNGILSEYTSRIPTKDFYLFMVPGEGK